MTNISRRKLVKVAAVSPVLVLPSMIAQAADEGNAVSSASDPINFAMIFTVPEEKMQRFEEVTAEQRRISATEENTILYETYRQDDGTFFHLERYTDEAAIMLHIQNTAPQLQEWMTIVELKQVIAAGPLSDEFKKQFSVDHYTLYGKQ